MNIRFLKFAYKYSLRSLSRNPRRAMLTIATVTFAVAVTLISARFTTAIMKLWQDGASDTGIAHAQVHQVGYWENAEGVDEQYTLESGNEAEAAVRNDPSVKAAAKRLKIEGIFSTGEKTVYFIGIGVSPSDELNVSPKLFSQDNDEGAFVSENDLSGVTIGKGLAEALKLKVGDEASLIAHTVWGSSNAVDVVVRGIVNVPLPSFSKRVVYMHISHAQKLIRMPNRYNELALRLNEGVDIEGWVGKSSAKINAGNAELRGWWQVDPIIKDVEEIFDFSVGIISLLLFLSSGLSVLNMIFMLVAERTIEIGTLMAIGAIGRDVRRLFTIEAAIIGILGGVLGMLVGNLGVSVMNWMGVPFKNPFSSGVILVHPTISPEVSILVAVSGMIICCIAALAPAYKASKVEPVQAFRGQVV